MLHIFYFTPRYKMTTPKRSIGLLPARLIRDFSKPVTRSNWREGSILNATITHDRWWEDYIYSWGNLHNDESWHDWCVDKLIIGPPRYRSGREMAELDDAYLTGEEFLTHCLPWIKTWAEREDYSWCTGPHHTTLPKWVTAEYIAAPNPTVC